LNACHDQPTRIEEESPRSASAKKALGQQEEEAEEAAPAALAFEAEAEAEAEMAALAEGDKAVGLAARPEVGMLVFVCDRSIIYLLVCQNRVFWWGDQSTIHTP